MMTSAVELGATVVFVCRSSVANVSTHQVAESAAAPATVSPRSLHHSVAGGLLYALSLVSSDSSLAVVTVRLVLWVVCVCLCVSVCEVGVLQLKA